MALAYRSMYRGHGVEKRTRIIILNGVGSAGKGSIAKALQQIASRPFLHVEMDAFLAMLPEAYFAHPDGLIFETVTRDGKPSVDIKTGRRGRASLARHAARRGGARRGRQ